MEQEQKVQPQCLTQELEREKALGRLAVFSRYPKDHTLNWSKLLKIIGWQKFLITFPFSLNKRVQNPIQNYIHQEQILSIKLGLQSA